MAATTKRTGVQLRIDTTAASPRVSISSISPSPSPKIFSPRDKKARTSFPLSPAMGTELERLKQTYTPVEKMTKPPPDERPLRRSYSTNSSQKQVPGPQNTKFRSLGGKVTNLLRVRKAFATTKKDEDDIITSNKHLPKEPRFSSSLSPAAQYAMMKGYEDAVYENLCRHYPASKLFLKRSRTPPKANIDINDIGKLIKPAIPENGPSKLIQPAIPENEPEVELNKTDNEKLENSVLILTRRNNLAPIKRSGSETLNSVSDSKPHNRRALARTKSMPVIVQANVPLQKRLILSHRLQSAMDILDTVRGNVGQHCLSPRISNYPRQIQPVSDFNQWSSIWSHEFKISKHGKAK